MVNPVVKVTFNTKDGGQSPVMNAVRVWQNSTVNQNGIVTIVNTLFYCQKRLVMRTIDNGNIYETILSDYCVIPKFEELLEKGGASC